MRELMKIPKFHSPFCAQDIATSYRGKVDVVVGLDARGFLYAPIMAAELGVPFVPVSIELHKFLVVGSA